jgi:hypothetical protein
MDFDCFSLGYVYVEIWVTDASGNQDLCETFVFVDDNIGVCQGPPLIAGEIKTGEDQPVNGVQVGLNGTSQSMGFTADDGYFSFEVPNGGDYTLTPAKDTLPLNGVTTFDLVLISKHILGTQLLDSPYKIIADDANKSNSITTSDLVAIRKLILHLSNGFPNNSSWRFIQKDFVFPDPANPFISAFPEILNLNNLSGDVLNGNFVGIKTGDVNWSADPQN